VYKRASRHRCIGDDVHVVVTASCSLALEESGFQVFNLRTRSRPDHFRQAALEVNAHAVFVLRERRGEYWLCGFRRQLRTLVWATSAVRRGTWLS